MLKRLAILAGTLAVFGSNVALAEPTLELGGPNASAPARAERLRRLKRLRKPRRPARLKVPRRLARASCRTR